ncbi:unnamed protein product [[Candida] boidinii]|nr:unnamed protein product [[Candida] boidinii]
MQFTPENFTMEFTMYFKAPTSGFYDFYFDSIDDGAMAFMGNGAFACCDNTDISIAVDGTQMLFATWSSWTGPTGDSASVFLVGEIYYPMRIVFINHQNIGTLSFTLKYGDEELDLKNYLFRLPHTVQPTQCTVSSIFTPIPVTTTVPCFTCSAPVTVTGTTTITTGTKPTTEVYVTVSEPVDTLTTTVPSNN